MKYIYSCLLFVVAIHCFGQNQDTTSENDIVIPTKEYPYLMGQVGFGALSNSLSTVELAHFVTTSFLDDDEKKELLASIPSALRFAYMRSFEAGYYQPGYTIYDVYKQGWGIGLRNTYYNSGALSKDMLNLIFYGNKPYAGTTVDAGKSAMETWYFSSIDYQFDIMLDTLLPLHITYSIHIGHDHRDILVNTAEIYTDPVGEFLDADLDYTTQNMLESTSPLSGIGASVGAAIDLPIKDRGVLHFEVNDLGVMYWTNGEVLDVDSTFRFEGVYFDNILDLNDSIRDHARDQYGEAFYYSESKDYLKMMPFSLAAKYSHKPNNYKWLKEVFAGANYRYLPGYYPQLVAGGKIKTAYKQHLTTELTAGGYTWAALNLAYHFEIGYDWKIDLAIYNFNGLVIPVMSGGTYGTLAVRYRL